ncbi:VRR-NUC domain-containing protein [Pseudomonas sp. RP23018S]|uniref:VRR-NUC domain-containing protein n=1 Tax=Pseudomonas sp. RP23018S TaxID=3096037 RepID=UPI002ACA0B6E|nr:VRR-NUC domain-containing protein [Pseudomonas sp. RP23018S]MDZ5603643.1 VRR-NUC domain-containing protein [Pseudomonas sp. RP23018S]
MIAHSVEDPFYYLHNFRQVLAWVELRYVDLLEDEEQAFIRGFTDLPQTSQALLVRMVMRKGELFRTDRLAYAEIGCTHAALAPLLVRGWVCDDAPLSVEQLGVLLRKDELALGFSHLLKQPRAAKSQLLSELAELQLLPRPLAEWLPGFPVAIVHWRLQALCDRLRLLFFGNLYQDWSEFVLADMGLLRFEQVAFCADSRALRQRSEVALAMALHQCAEQLEAGAPPAQLLGTLQGLQAENPWLERRRSRLLFQVGQQCERLADWPLALAVYQDCGHAESRIRQVRVHERSEQWQAAFELASQMAAAPANALEAQACERMVPRLMRKLGGPPQPRRRARAVSTLELELPRELASLGVERAVRQHLLEGGGEVHYVENTLFNSLFGLLCWEAVFAPIPGAFFHPFQSAPQDLHDADFQLRRQAQFDRCIEQLADGSYRQVIPERFTTKYGLQSPFVVWQVLTPALLEQALHCLPPAHLQACFLRLLQDIRNNRTGMPDLIQFWPEQGRYRMIEVKGPGDRLQDNQLRWLAFCEQHGLPVEVCHVRWREAA